MKIIHNDVNVWLDSYMLAYDAVMVSVNKDGTSTILMTTRFPQSMFDIAVITLYRGAGDTIGHRAMYFGDMALATTNFYATSEG